MKHHNPYSVQLLRPFALMVVSAMLVSGCLDSNESSTSEPTTSEPVVSELVVSDAPTTEELIEVVQDETTDTDPVVVDPLIQNKIPVTIEMIVPFYLSDELRVELVWGDISLDAMWVGDQRWSVSGEFPTDTENLLMITFYDKNGAIELARYRQNYKTASNVSEAVQIQAEQFDATVFDDDGDGISNLDELNAGTDPLVDEGAQLEVEDFYSLSDHNGVFSRLSVSESFESRLPNLRPYRGMLDSHPDWGELFSRDLPISGDIVINSDGSGTLTTQAGEARPQLSLSGTRTHTGSSISWAGVRREWSDDYYHEENATNTVTIVDDNFRSFVADVTGSNTGTYEYQWQSTANLTGSLIEGSSLCAPVAGTFSATHWTTSVRGQYESIVEITIGKSIEDRYWRVEVSEDNILDDRFKFTEYFVRELRIQQRADVPDSAHFVCDFVDI